MGETGTNTVTVPVSINAVTVMEINPVREGVYDIRSFPYEGEVRSVDEIELPATIILDADSDPDLEKCDDNARMLVAFLYERQRVYDEWLAEHSDWLAEHPEEAAKHTKWVCAHPDWIVEHFQWLSEQPDWMDYCAAWVADGRPTAAKRRRYNSKHAQGIVPVSNTLGMPKMQSGYINDIDDVEENDVSGITSLITPNESAFVFMENGLFKFQLPGTKVGINGKIVQDAPMPTLSDYDKRLFLTLYMTIFNAIMPRLENEGLNYNDTVHFGVSVTTDDLGRKMFREHKGSGLSRDDIERIISKIRQFQNMIGILYSKTDPNAIIKYPVLRWAGYNSENKTISFDSPFLSMISRQALIENGRLDRWGQPLKTHTKKTPLFRINSALVKSTILSQRNLRACEMVCIICHTIESSEGSHEPSILAASIVKKMDGFYEKLKASSPSYRANRIQKTFEKAFELLKTETYLKDVYPGIRLPDPNEYPTWSRLNSTRYFFSHNGMDTDVYEQIQRGTYDDTKNKA